MTNTAPRFRFLGTTDDVIQCERCGKDELRSTVVLEVLDADGNAEDVTYYGSTCAARVLTERTGRKHTGPKVLAEARAALTQLQNRMESARRLLAHYAAVEADDAAFLAAVKDAHRTHWRMDGYSSAEWLTFGREMMARNRQTIAAAEAALHPAA